MMTKLTKYPISMRNSLIVLIIFLLPGLYPSSTMAQNMSINDLGNAPDGSAMLDISSTNKGFLLPRMTQSQRIAISSPANGLIVYQTDGDVGLYIFNNTVWSKVVYLDNLNLTKVLELGRTANADTILDLGALSIGNNTLPKSSLVIDSFLTVQGQSYSDFRWYGFNTYVDQTNNLRFLHDKQAGLLAFGSGKTILGHWDEGESDSIVPSSANSQIELSNDRITIEGTASDFLVDLRGKVKTDSLSVGPYNFPVNLGSNGQVLTTNGSGLATWENAQLDNLGSHIATQNIQLGNFYLSGDGGNEGIHVAPNGNVTVGNNTGFENFAVWNDAADAEIGINSEVASSNLNMRARGLNSSNTITAFRSRGSSSSQLTVVPNDDLFTLNVQPFNGSSSTVYKALNVSVTGISGGDVSTKIGLYTTTPSGINAERLTIDDNGRIGISKTNPNATLDVNGDIQLSGELRTTITGSANMIPIAYGYVSPSGVLSGSAGSLTVARLAPGLYEITISGRTYSNTSMVTNATIVGSTYGFITTDVNSGKLLVRTKNASGIDTDIQFHFVVYQP